MNAYNVLIILTTHLLHTVFVFDFFNSSLDFIRVACVSMDVGLFINSWTRGYTAQEKLLSL